MHFIFWFIGWSHSHTKVFIFQSPHSIISIEDNNVHGEVRRETMQINGPCLSLIICLNSLENHHMVWDTEFTLDVRSKIIFLFSGCTPITNTHLNLFTLFFFSFPFLFYFLFFWAYQPTMQINKLNGSTQSKTLRFLHVNLLTHWKWKITGISI